MPPSVAELERSTGWRDLYPLLRLAAARGQVEAVERDRYYAKEALEGFIGALEESGGARPAGHQPQISDPFAGVGGCEGNHGARRRGTAIEESGVGNQERGPAALTPASRL
jgi:hypothetical protein